MRPHGNELRSPAGTASAAQSSDHVAERELHWLRAELGAWLIRSSSAADWTGWRSSTAAAVHCRDSWVPWCTCIDTRDEPLLRWFAGARTSAAFNEIDRHVLQAAGTNSGSSTPAFLAEAVGGACETLHVRELLVQSTLAAMVLTSSPPLGLGVGTGARVALYLPNDPRAPIWISAAKRAAMPYVAVASGTASTALASRLDDTRAAALLTSDELLPPAHAACASLDAPPAGVRVPDATTRAALASSSTTSLPDGWTDATAHMHAARERLPDEMFLLVLSTERQLAALWSLATPAAVDASFPLFILYTSGSTGKPKGIVHAHGGYEVGLRRTSRVVLDPQPYAPHTCFEVQSTRRLCDCSQCPAIRMVHRTESVTSSSSWRRRAGSPARAT